MDPVSSMLTRERANVGEDQAEPLDVVRECP
jgi:hypothetical protein